MNMRYLIKILFLILCVIAGIPEKQYAQEVLLPLNGHHLGNSIANSKGSRLKVDNVDTLQLPFFEDFSRPGIIPDQNIWTDQYVYVNNSYSEDPVSIGIGTLDAVYSDGSLNGVTKDPFLSDFLTSKPIKLAFPGRSDIWLSFYYQPQGLGDYPEASDSLLIDFYAPEEQKWYTVWSDTGKEITEFHQIFIQIKEEKYLKAGFQFRFKNYASLPKSLSFPSKNANLDHWNIDYIYLDTARVNNVTAINDVSMIYDLESLIQTYESIPWSHFKRAYQTHIKPFISVTYRNNDTTTRNVTRKLEISDMTEYKKVSFSGGAMNIQANEKVSYDFIYNFPFIFYERDSVLFEIKSYLVTDELDYKWNDTVTRRQEFYNYYAYDDGSAEAGYGLQGEGTMNARVAYRFESFEKDTLRGVQMYFNKTLDDVSTDFFQLTVWDHDRVTNQPGAVIYSMLGAKPLFGSEVNQLKIYEFDTLLTVNNIFYVGWIKTTEDMLNVGFDRNKVNNNKIYYNLGQEWNNSSFAGSLMIRPLLGYKIIYPVSTEQVISKDFSLYPNPVSERLMIESAYELEEQEFIAFIYNIQGSLVHQASEYQNGIDVSGLPRGIYLLALKNDSGEFLTRKFMVQR